VLTKQGNLIVFVFVFQHFIFFNMRFKCSLIDLLSMTNKEELFFKVV